MATPLLAGLGRIADRYDGFILDIWGVIHDGHRPYPGAVDALTRLRDAGKRIILLSNAPRRADSLIAALTTMGVSRGLYDGAMSSGEAVHRALAERRDPWYAALGRRCHHLGPPRDAGLFDGLDLELVPLEAAEFVVTTGTAAESETVADYETALRAAAARRLPMICANPDHVVVHRGRPWTCAGALAARYEALGGQVSYRGKPDPRIYAVCLDRLGLADRARVLAVGDGLHTDIAGATAAGLDAVFVTGGVHAAELGVRDGEAPTPERLDQLLARHRQRPLAALAAFVW